MEVFYLDEPDVFFFQLSLIGEETDEVDLIDLVFFADGKVEGRPFGFIGNRGGWRQLDGDGLFLYIPGEGFFGGEDQDGGSAGIHAGRSAVAVDEDFFGVGQVIVDDIANVG